MLDAIDIRISDFDLPARIANVHFAVDALSSVTRPIYHVRALLRWVHSRAVVRNMHVPRAPAFDYLVDLHCFTQRITVMCRLDSAKALQSERNESAPAMF